VSAPDAERALPDEVYDLGVRALLRCGPEHTHISIGHLRAMAADVGDLRAALEVAHAAGRASVLDQADVIEQWAVRAVPGAPISPLIYPTPEAALESCVVPGDTVWRRVVAYTPWQPAPGAGAGREEENR